MCSIIENKSFYVSEKSLRIKLDIQFVYCFCTFISSYYIWTKRYEKVIMEGRQTLRRANWSEHCVIQLQQRILHIYSNPSIRNGLSCCIFFILMRFCYKIKNKVNTGFFNNINHCQLNSMFMTICINHKINLLMILFQNICQVKDIATVLWIKTI